MSSNQKPLIRETTKADVSLILQLIKELAKYEKLANEVVATESILSESLFVNKHAEAFIIEVNQQPIGFAIIYHNFSSFLGKAGLYLEDIYIKPEFRHLGYGKQMLKFLAHLATSRGCERIEWSVLNWNESSIKFYQKIGALPMNEWTTYRLHRKEINNLKK